MATGRRVGDLVIERGLMDAAQLEAILKPEVLTQPRHRNSGPASGKRLEP